MKRETEDKIEKNNLFNFICSSNLHLNLHFGI